MLLVWHKASFRENEAAWQCVTMWKRSVSIRATKWHLTFWHISPSKNYVFVTSTSGVNSAKTRFSPFERSLRKWMLAPWPSRWCQKDRGSECFRSYYIYVIYICVYICHIMSLCQSNDEVKRLTKLKSV